MSDNFEQIVIFPTTVKTIATNSVQCIISYVENVENQCIYIIN